MQKAIVIGAGVGGLASAIRLSLKGYKTTIFEKNSYAGGKLTELRLNGFRFDAGPSLFTLPELLDELFIEANVNPSDYYSYEKLDLITRYFYPDGTILNAYADPERFAKEVNEKTGESKTAVLKYLEYSKTIYDLTKSIFLDRSLHKISTYLRKEALPALLNLHKVDAFRKMHAANSAKFSSNKLIQLFDRYATYNGSNPFKAPATLNIISHLEHNLGAFFLDGGMHKLTESLSRLAKDKGVEFQFNSAVSEILVQNNKAIGIKLNGKEVFADIVVSNMDIVPTYRKLLKNVKEPSKILNQEKSSSALIFYWGMSGLFPELDMHNIFFSQNYEEEFSYLSEGHNVYNDPTVYVYISSKLCKSDAPEGKENWFVMVNVPHIKGQNWDNIIANVRASITKKVSDVLGYSIDTKIECEEVLDPRGIEERTSSYLGALYGNSSNNMFAAFLRHPNFSREIQGLYFCGGSVHPGGGIPLCLSSAKIISQIVR